MSSRRKIDCHYLGLEPARVGQLRTVVYRLTQAAAHVREAWADSRREEVTREVLVRAVRQLRAPLSTDEARAFDQVLVYGLDDARAEQLLRAVGGNPVETFMDAGRPEAAQRILDATMKKARATLGRVFDDDDWPVDDDSHLGEGAADLAFDATRERGRR